MYSTRTYVVRLRHPVANDAATTASGQRRRLAYARWRWRLAVRSRPADGALVSASLGERADKRLVGPVLSPATHPEVPRRASERNARMNEFRKPDVIGTVYRLRIGNEGYIRGKRLFGGRSNYPSYQGYWQRLD